MTLHTIAALRARIGSKTGGRWRPQTIQQRRIMVKSVRMLVIHTALVAPIPTSDTMLELLKNRYSTQKYDSLPVNIELVYARLKPKLKIVMV